MGTTAPLGPHCITPLAVTTSILADVPRPSSPTTATVTGDPQPSMNSVIGTGHRCQQGP